MGRAGWVALAVLAAVAGCGSAPDGDAARGQPAARVPPAVDAGARSKGADAGTDAPALPYPAEAPPAPQVQTLGGPVLASATVVPVFFSRDDAGTVTSLTDFVARVGASSFWKAATSEYGVGAATSAPPVHASSSDDPPAALDDSAVQTWLAGKLDANDPAFAPPAAGTVYLLFYPAGVGITFDGAESCDAFSGYHNELALDAAHGGAHVPYAVVPRCASDVDAGAATTGIDAITQVASHELVEAVTDPLPVSNPAWLQVDDAHFYWTEVLGGSELADMCARASGAVMHEPDLPYAVQRSWSNAAASAGHDPCVPAAAEGAYFDGAPAFDVVTTDVSGQSIEASGVHVPVGGSATVRLNLFSDGPTGEWSVDARPALGWTGDLAFSFDRTQGANGDALSMTIQVLRAGRYDRELFVVTSTMGGTQHTWIGLVTN